MQTSKGVWFMVIATFFFALMNVGVKLIPNIPAVQIVFIRSVVSFILSLVILKANGVNPLGHNRKLLFLRGLFGAIALILYFITLQRIPLASAVTIQFLAPIFTTILGIFVVREYVAGRQWFYFLIAFIGVVLIQGFDPRITFEVFLIGIFAAFFSGLAYNIIRKLNTSENPLVIVFYFPLVTIPITGIYVAFRWIQPTAWEWIILLLVGICTQIAQFFMTKAYQRDELSKIVILKYLGIVYALFFGFVLFGESFAVLSYLGMGLVLIGIFLNVRYKMARP